MAHAQKPDFVFPRNGRVNLNRWGRQFSRLLAAEVCASTWVMLDRPRSEVAWEYWLPTPFACFPFTSTPVRHRVPPGSERALRNTLAVFHCMILLPVSTRCKGEASTTHPSLATQFLPLNFSLYYKFRSYFWPSSGKTFKTSWERPLYKIF